MRVCVVIKEIHILEARGHFLRSVCICLAIIATFFSHLPYCWAIRLGYMYVSRQFDLCPPVLLPRNYLASLERLTWHTGTSVKWSAASCNLICIPIKLCLIDKHGVVIIQRFCYSFFCIQKQLVPLSFCLCCTKLRIFAKLCAISCCWFGNLACPMWVSFLFQVLSFKW